MPKDTSRKRPRVIWWVVGGLSLLLLALIGYQLLARRTRFVSDDRLLTSLASSVLLESEPPDPASWPQWRGAGRDGVGAGDLLADWPTAGPPALWRVKGGHGYSSFAVADGRLYGMIGEDGKQLVVAWDTADGKRLWERECGASSPSDYGADYGGPRATPTLDGGRLYTVSSKGLLLCLDAASGEVKWQADLVKDAGGSSPRWGYATSPLVEGGMVYVMPGGGGGRSLAAFDKLTGERAWSSLNDMAGYSSPLAVTVAGVRQVVCLTGKRLVGVTPDKGELLWALPWEDRVNVNAATPVHVRTNEGDYFFISSGYGRGCALVSVAGENGAFAAKVVYESNELCCHFASPVRHGEHLYALDETRDLTCLEVKTGQVKWRHRGYQKGSLLRVGDRLLALAERGQLGLLECDPEKYAEVARCKPFESKCWTMPVLADGRLYLRDQAEVLCLDLRKP